MTAILKMGRQSYFLLLFQLLVVQLSGQNLPDSITIRINTYISDYNGGDTIYETNRFRVVSVGTGYRLNNKSISNASISRFLTQLTRQNRNENSISDYGIDTTRIRQRSSELLKYYKNEHDFEWNVQQKQFINKQLSNVTSYQTEFKRYLTSGCCYGIHQGDRNDFRISIYEQGELKNQITSRRRVYGYLMPWTNLIGDTLNSYGIESSLTDIISIYRQRKPPLKGDRLLKYLVNKIVDYNNASLYKLSAYSFQKEIDELKSNFEVKSFEEVYGRGRYISKEPKVIKVALKNSSMRNYVTLNFMASVHGKTMYSRDSVKRESPTIIKRIQSIKFMMDFLDRNPSAKLDIYYFNNTGVNDYNVESVNKNPETWARHDKYVESLKWYEKRNIAPSFDLQEAIKVSRQLDCGCNFRFDRKYLTKAIFFELIDGDRNSSLWFLLPDDKVLLYLMQGEKVVDFSYTEFDRQAGLQYPCVLFNLNGLRIEK